MRQRSKQFILFVLLSVTLIVMIFGLKHYLSQHGQRQAPMPPLVVGKKLKPSTWQMVQDYTAVAVSQHAVGVTAQVAGQVTAHHINSGGFVKKGELLVALDDKLDQQSYRKYKAQARLAKADLARKLAVYNAGGISRSELDAARATFRVARANARSAQIAIGYKKIRAPFSGWGA